MTGIADGKVHQLRIQATKAQGRLPKGAVAYLRLRVAEDGSAKDPGVIAAAEAARSWGMCAIQPTKALPRTMMEECCAGASGLLEKERPWSAVKDPAGAMRLSMARAGVSMPSAFELSCSYPQER